MEVFRYMTPYVYEIAKQADALQPRQLCGALMPMYALPEDPIIWGVHETFRLIEWIRRTSGMEPEVLVKWNIPLSATQVFVQEESGEHRRRPISEYRRKDFVYPEVVILKSVPLKIVQLVEFPAVLRKRP